MASSAGPSPSRRNLTQATCGLGLSLTAISWAAVLIVLTRSSPVVVAFGRLALAVLLLTPALLLPEVRRQFAHWRSVLPQALGAGALLGLHLLLWIASLRLTSVASSMFLLTSQALFALVLSHTLLGERVSLRGWLAVGVGALGGAVIVAGDVTAGVGLAGAGLAVGSALAFVLYLVLGRTGRRRMGNTAWILLVYTAATVALAPFLPLGVLPPSGDLSRELWLLLALAAGPTILGHGLMNFALRHVRIHVVNLTVLAEPLLAIGWAWWALGKEPPAWTLSGGALLLLGCALAVREEAREAALRSRQRAERAETPT